MPDFPPHLSPPVLALLFAGAMAVLAVVRGVLRLIRTVVALLIGFAVGTYVFMKAPGWLDGMITHPSGQWTVALSVIGGALGHIGSAFVMKSLFGGPDAGGAGGPPVAKSTAILLSLLPSGALIWLGGVALRLTGTLSGMAHLDQGHLADQPWLAQARDALNHGVLGRVFNATDPVTRPELVRLCEILVVYRDASRWKAVSRDPALGAVLGHPKFRRLLGDRDVKQAVAFSDYPRLLTLPEVRAAAADPTLAEALRQLPIPEVRRAERVE